jgi:putative transposase
MSKLLRNADPDDIVSDIRTFFVTTKTAAGRRLLQTERNANLLIDVLRTSVTAKNFEVHDFVIMPDHVHILLSIGDDITIEKAMQLIKGGFSYRLKNEFAFSGEVWQRGFADERIRDRGSFAKHREYIRQNPVKAGLVDEPEKFPFSFRYLARQKVAGAKAQQLADTSGTTEVVPFHETRKKCETDLHARST